MDTVAPSIPQQNTTMQTPVQQALSQARSFAGQPAIRRAMPAIILVGAAALGLIAYFLFSQPDRMTLYTGLPEAQKSQAMATLEAAGVDVVLNRTTGELQVTQADYHRARMALAAEGLPQANPDGLSVISDMPMGTSRSVESARLRRMLELDLARSITELQPVTAARVHLALPERTAFIRDTRPPQASVVVQVQQGRSLDPGQVQAIIGLVATSVPGMESSAVSVVDQAGRLLTDDSSDIAGRLNATQMEHRARLEAQYRKRIEALITPLVGVGNAAVEVTLDMDFTRSEITREEYMPDGQVLRSEQLNSEQNTRTPAQGIPGAVANTPPANGELQADNEAGQAAPAEIGSLSESSTRNYEISRRVETIQPQTAKVQRINAAVLLRAPSAPTPVAAEAPADGAEATETAPVTEVQALPPEVVAAIEQLTRTAIGFNMNRGDVVTVTTGAFIDTFDTIEPAWHEASWIPMAARQGGQLLIFAIIVLGVVRPILSRLLQPAPVSALESPGFGGDAVEVGEGESLNELRKRLEETGLDGGLSYEEKVKFLQNLAGQETQRIATVFQGMIAGERDMVQ